MKHLLTMDELSKEEIEELLNRAAFFKKAKKTKFEKEVYAVNLFFEPSTRTHTSFEMAEKKLGINVLSFEPGASSITKGESLYDTALTMQAIGVDVAVIRHQDENFFDALRSLDMAIINGGDGCGEHPSQCLLDLFTIQEQFGYFEGLKVGIVGDISHSRVANSNMKVLKRLGASLYFAGPDSWFKKEQTTYGKHIAMDELVKNVDVVMLLRVQHERHDEEIKFDKETYHKTFGLTEERAGLMRENAIIMHPSPVNRDAEIADSLVESEKSRIITQMTNGVYIRMAILEAVLKEKK
ncbi:aspartate carbamoyltransferase catalytic subunit [Listeria fleischmannii 1991]|uniref:Aspartate carbamoyltransferase n=2 Tax=Listeria fleischmannii TaxID=1069827 RepID=A0A2X3HAC4_9LIST|nr:aspartate carbamoyltransferase catalytic subunit [Listeria fleischmannii]EMG27033.1 aspartate carbamoyltransferase catalytic subunit [Listeria fleischmannii subsp. fleischmannii LU2006-1]KMT61108.1 aspartate carbamoyltransferase catalytic subunit [Listeria fleischmannii 1991]SQC71516.1 Aspartate carbamoyltransferase [Listeria fleischmannii subsp. fleischmannii]